MLIETKLVFNEYLRLMFILTYRKPLMIFLTCVGLIMFLGSIFYFFGFDVPIDKPPYFQLIFGCAIIVLVPFSIYKSSKKNFSSHGRLQEKIVYEFTEDKMKIIGETFNSEMSWEKTYKILELKNWILIYQNRIVAIVIPKESFGSNFSEFKQWIANKPSIKNNFSPIKKYLRILIISFWILPFALAGLLYIFSKAEPEEFIIPKNYHGEVIIFFDQQNGEPIRYLNKIRVYEIPDDGILFTQFTWNSGIANHKFSFLVDKEKVKINEVNDDYSFEKGNGDSDIVSVINKGPYYYKSADGKSYLFRADQFIISDRKGFNNYSVESKMDSIIEEEFN